MSFDTQTFELLQVLINEFEELDYKFSDTNKITRELFEKTIEAKLKIKRFLAEYSAVKISGDLAIKLKKLGITMDIILIKLLSCSLGYLLKDFRKTMKRGTKLRHIYAVIVPTISTQIFIEEEMKWGQSLPINLCPNIFYLI